MLRGPVTSELSSHSAIRVVCVSDTHTHKPKDLPAGDILIHAGDLSNDGTVSEIQNQVDWLSTLPYEHKIVISGNHDSFFDPRARRKEDLGRSIRWEDVHYLQHSGLRLSFPKQGHRQLLFFGAPQIPQCGSTDFAFQYRRNHDAWSNTIPPETDVLITHTPPRHHLDLPIGMGCEFLLKEMWRVRPTLCVFGHVHAGWGKENVFWDETQRLMEKLCARGEGGVFRDLIAVYAWIDVLRLLVYGLLGILWSRVWGGSDQASTFVNSSLVYRSSGQLGNPPQAVHI